MFSWSSVFGAMVLKPYKEREFGSGEASPHTCLLFTRFPLHTRPDALAFPPAHPPQELHPDGRPDGQKQTSTSVKSDAKREVWVQTFSVL